MLSQLGAGSHDSLDSFGTEPLQSQSPPQSQPQPLHPLAVISQLCCGCSCGCAGLANCWFNTVVLLLFGAVIQMSLGRGFGQAWAAAAAAAAAGEEHLSIQHSAYSMRHATQARCMLVISFRKTSANCRIGVHRMCTCLLLRQLHLIKCCHGLLLLGQLAAATCANLGHFLIALKLKRFAYFSAPDL